MSEKILELPHEASGARQALWGLATLWGVLALLYVFFGTYNDDEGWYALISREVWRGRELYSDIRYTQMPALPYLYGTLLSWIPPRLELARLLSLAVTGAGVIALGRLLLRRYGRWPAFAGLAVLLLDPLFTSEVTRLRSQGLAFALGAGSLVAAERVYAGATEASARIGMLSRTAFAGGLLAGFSFLTRLSHLPHPLVFAAWSVALLGKSSRPRGERLRAALCAALGALLIPGAIVAAFLFRDTDRFLFGVYRFHVLNQPRPPEEGIVAQVLARFLRFLEAVTPSLLSFAVGVAGIALLACCMLRKSPDRPATTSSRQQIAPPLRSLSLESLVALSWLGTTAIHALQQTPLGVYQVSVAWGPPVLLAWSLHRLGGQAPRAQRLAACAFSVAAAILFSARYGALEFSGHRIPSGMAEVRSILRNYPGARLLTYDSGIAWMTPEVKLLPGCEMSQFSYYPRIPEAVQRHYRGSGPEHLRQAVERDADLLALRATDLDNLLVYREQVRQTSALITRHFTLVATLPRYGQGGHTLRLYARRGGE